MFHWFLYSLHSEEECCQLGRKECSTGFLDRRKNNGVLLNLQRHWNVGKTKIGWFKHMELTLSNVTNQEIARFIAASHTSRVCPLVSFCWSVWRANSLSYIYYIYIVLNWALNLGIRGYTKWFDMSHSISSKDKRSKKSLDRARRRHLGHCVLRFVFRVACVPRALAYSCGSCTGAALMPTLLEISAGGLAGESATQCIFLYFANSCQMMHWSICSSGQGGKTTGARWICTGTQTLGK